MLRFALPAVLGLCGFGAERFHEAHRDHDRHPPVIERCVEERCEPDGRRRDFAPRDERCEPRHERSWHFALRDGVRNFGFQPHPPGRSSDFSS